MAIVPPITTDNIELFRSPMCPCSQRSRSHILNICQNCLTARLVMRTPSSLFDQDVHICLCGVDDKRLFRLLI